MIDLSRTLASINCKGCTFRATWNKDERVICVHFYGKASTNFQLLFSSQGATRSKPNKRHGHGKILWNEGLHFQAVLVSNVEAVGYIKFYIRDVLNKLSKRVIVCTTRH